MGHGFLSYLLVTWVFVRLVYAFGTERNIPSKLRNEIYLDRDKVLKLKWDVDYKKEVAYFRLNADFGSEKWFGFGFSDYGDPTNADVVVSWTDHLSVHHFQRYSNSDRFIGGGNLVNDVKSNNCANYLYSVFQMRHSNIRTRASEARVLEAVDHDAWSDMRGILHVDDRQDYFIVEAFVSSTQTEILFYRKFDTCDDHDYQLDNGTTHIIFFVSDGRPQTVDGTNVTAINPGLQRVQLLKPEVIIPIFPTDVWTFEVTAPQVHVPVQQTTYWWYVTQIPELRHKHHVIKYEGVIEKGSENLVHHIEVFHCEVSREQVVKFYNGPGAAEGRPPELVPCGKVIGAWAMGAQPLVLPEEAGTPIGSPDFSRFVLLEVHYNNPELKSGIIDSSGIRFYVTSQLRKYDAGIMELGLEYTDKMAIPPRQEIFDFTGFCIQECTQIGLPEGGIKMFASQLHSHLTGRRLYTKRLRNGIELPELNRDNHYSPHFQEIRQLPEPVEILPGDSLITTCEDSTLDRENVTFGGLSIQDEMCVNYVHYYPRVDLEVCKSSIATAALLSYFQFMKRWDGDDTSPTKGIEDNYNAIRWTPLNVHLLKTLYITSPLSMQCNQSDGRRFPGNWEGVPLTKMLLPLPKIRRNCPAEH